MDPVAWRRIRNRALILWALVIGSTIAFSIPSGPPPSPLAVLVWLAASGLAALLGLPLAFGLSYAVDWLHQRRQRRIQAEPSSRPTIAGALVPFRYSARQWKATGGILLFVSALMALAWLLPPPRGSPSIISTAFRWLTVAFAGLTVPLGLLRLRRITFEVDDRGIRTEGRFRPFDIPWDRLDRIEVVPQMGLRFALSAERGLPKGYALWRKERTVGGIMAPGAELGRREGARFEEALTAFATQHGIAVVEVSWRTARRWWKMRKRAESDRMS